MGARRNHLALPFERAARCALFAVMAAVVALWSYAHLAPFQPPASRIEPPGTVVLDANGVVLQRDTKRGVRIPVTLDQVAPLAIEATLAAEDERFAWHPGVDPVAVAREALTFWDNPGGASTITQQVARGLYLDGGTGWLPARKVREALTGLQLEAHLSKDEILEAYLNNVYYGRGAYGIEAAARVYFGTSAANLDLAQASMLAGLPQLPAIYTRGAGVGAAEARQAYVLDRMVTTGAISGEEARRVRAGELHLLGELAPAIAPHFVQYALDELARVRPDLAGQPGLVIETTLDSALQGEAAGLVAHRVARISDYGANNAAALVIDPESGRILVMVGNTDFFDEAHSGQVNMATALRQPGSALKPFLYAATMERGYTAATPLLDVPTTFDTESGPYAPGNYDRRFHGVVPLRVALASSYNVPAVRTLDELGIDAFLEVVHRFGLDTLDNTANYGLALTLGGGEVRLIDLVAAYGAFATGGVLHEPYAIERVRDATGAVVYEREPDSGRRVVSEEIAYVIGDILADRDARIPGFGSPSPLDTSMRSAVKTGTTTGFKDNWTVGYTPGRVAGAWVGNADGAPMYGISGVDGAGPLWRDLMEASLAGQPERWLAQPPGLQWVTVCTPTGLLPGDDCPSPYGELFLRGTEPTGIEGYYERGPDGVLRIDPPVEARAWAADAGLPLVDVAGPRSEAGIHIVQPGSGSVLYFAPELQQQAFVVRAALPPGAVGVTFRQDGRVLGTANPEDPRLVTSLEPGHHQIEAEATLADGRIVRATTNFEVRVR